MKVLLQSPRRQEIQHDVTRNVVTNPSGIAFEAGRGDEFGGPMCINSTLHIDSPTDQSRQIIYRPPQGPVTWVTMTFPNVPERPGG